MFREFLLGFSTGYYQ